MKKSVANRNSIVSGFTLIELMVSIALMCLMAGYFIYNRTEALKEQLARNIAQQILTIGNKASEYYAASNPNQWPDGLANCQNPLNVLDGEYLPSGYSASVALTFDCQPPVAGIATAFSISADFGKDSDGASLVESMLPVATLDKSDLTHIKIVYVVTPPRILGQSYSFYKEKLKGGEISVDKPTCATGTAKYIAIPQAVCKPTSSYLLNNSSNEFVGYQFKDVTGSSTASKWKLKLLQQILYQSVDTSSGNTTNLSDWNSTVPDTCNGSAVYVGVITYCGNGP